MWHFDTYGRQELCGYGSTFVPSSPGEHEVTCHIWRPMGSSREEMMHSFVGGGLQASYSISRAVELFQLGNMHVLEDPEERSKINTVSMGQLRLRLNVITRHFDRFGILA